MLHAVLHPCGPLGGYHLEMKGISNSKIKQHFKPYGGYPLEMKGISNFVERLCDSPSGGYHFEMKGISNHDGTNTEWDAVVIILK